MNKKIKELAIEAGFNKEHFEWHPPSCTPTEVLMLQEFAKLIIQECGKVADDLDGGQCGGASSYDLLRHFGLYRRAAAK